MADYQNYASAENQANQLGIQRQDAQNQAALMYQQGQKYAPSQLQAMGLGNTGLSETSQVGLMNTYSNIVNQSNRDYASGINKMYQDLAAANRESEINLNNQLNEYRQQALAKEELKQETTQQIEQQKQEQTLQQQTQSVQNAIANIDDPKVLEQYKEAYKDVISNNPDLQIQLGYKEQLLNQYQKQQEEAKMLETLYNNWGVTPETEQHDISTIDQSMFAGIFGSMNPKKDQYKAIQYVKEYGNEIPNGTVIDLNVGFGSSEYLIYNGKMYKVNKQKPSKGYDGRDLAKLYDEKKGNK